jgi:hypothetical protein
MDPNPGELLKWAEDFREEELFPYPAAPLVLPLVFWFCLVFGKNSVAI